MCDLDNRDEDRARLTSYTMWVSYQSVCVMRDYGCLFSVMLIICTMTWSCLIQHGWKMTLERKIYIFTYIITDVNSMEHVCVCVYALLQSARMIYWRWHEGWSLVFIRAQSYKAPDLFYSCNKSLSDAQMNAQIFQTREMRLCKAENHSPNQSVRIKALVN